MPALKIPDSEFAVLKTIAEVEDSAFSALVKAIEETDPKFIQPDLSEEVASRLPSLKASQLKPILRTALSLYVVMNSRKKSPEDLSNDLKETIETENPKGFPIEKTSILKD